MWMASFLSKVLIMNIGEKLPHEHKWEQTYTYSSLSMRDQSGTVTKGQACKCGKSRRKITTYKPNGSIDKLDIIDNE